MIYQRLEEIWEEGMSAAQIKESWKDDIESFMELRKPYLLYAE